MENGPENLKHESSFYLIRAGTWIGLYVMAAFQQISNEIMFVSQMAFFAQVSDVSFGGTYMTFLNTLANFGGRVSI